MGAIPFPFMYLASGACAKCFPSISLYLGLEEGGREKANTEKD